MTVSSRMSMLSSIAAVVALVFSASVFAEIDADAAKKTARKNSCFKCHAPDKEKEGPPFSKVAEKYRGKADAEQKVIEQITTGKKAKFPDGHEDEHKIIETQDKDEIKNLADWILSL